MAVGDTVRRALFWAGQLERAVAAMEDCEPVYKANAAQFLAAAAELRRYEQASQEGWDAMGRVQPVLQRAGTVKNGENDEAKAAAKAVREKYKKAGRLRTGYLMRFLCRKRRENNFFEGVIKHEEVSLHASGSCDGSVSGSLR